MTAFVRYFVSILGLVPLLASPVSLRAVTLDVPGSGLEDMAPAVYAAWLAPFQPSEESDPQLTIIESHPGAVLPGNAAAPCISWISDTSAGLVTCALHTWLSGQNWLVSSVKSQRGTPKFSGVHAYRWDIGAGNPVVDVRICLWLAGIFVWRGAFTPNGLPRLGS